MRGRCSATGSHLPRHRDWGPVSRGKVSGTSGSSPVGAVGWQYAGSVGRGDPRTDKRSGKSVVCSVAGKSDPALVLCSQSAVVSRQNGECDPSAISVYSTPSS